MTCGTNNKCICVKDCYNDNEIAFIKYKEYNYSYLKRINSSIIILSGIEKCEKEPQLAAIGFSHEDFKKYFIKYETYLRKQKLQKLQKEKFNKE